MNLFNNLEKSGIQPIMPLRVEERNYIAKCVAEKLANNVHDLSEMYNELYMRIFNCDIYYAKVDSKYKGVFYYYKNNTIYIDENKNIEDIDERLITECLHYIQNFNNITRKDNRAGLCEFTELKIKGLGINEAITQYIACKALGQEIHRVTNEKIAIYTNSEKYYKYMTSLAMQILYLIGSEEAIDSTINTNDEFETLLYNSFEENTDKILKNFDAILDENNSQTRNEEKIIQIYMQTQELIYKTYFTKVCKYLVTSQEIDEEVEKLENYNKIMGTLMNDDTYYNNFWQFKEEMSSVFFKKYISVSKQRTKNSLAVISKNQLYGLWKRILGFINGNKQKIK